MYVRAIVEEGADEQAILVPQQGVSRDNRGNPVAWIVNPDEKVEQRALRLDRAIDDQWLVTSGLSAGDRLIVEGLQKVRPGSPVKPVPFTSPEADPSNPGREQPVSGQKR
jgi:membrane fusion protein (multidrug efflux system)